MLLRVRLPGVSPALHHAANALIPTQHVLIPNTGLFLGGYYALSHVPELGVTHILSVVNGEMSRNMCAELLGANTRPIVRHHVDLIDTESSNLLVCACLPACLLLGVGKLGEGNRRAVNWEAYGSRMTSD